MTDTLYKYISSSGSFEDVTGIGYSDKAGDVYFNFTFPAEVYTKEKIHLASDPNSIIIYDANGVALTGPNITSVIASWSEADGNKCKLKAIAYSDKYSCGCDLYSTNYYSLESDDESSDEPSNESNKITVQKCLLKDKNGNYVIPYIQDELFLKHDDKSTVSGLGMPSNKYIDLSLGASNTEYTAPANGWFYINKISGSAGNYMNLFVNVDKTSTADYHQRCEYSASNQAPSDQTTLVFLVPVKQNDTVVVNYSASGTLYAFRFIYAEGEI